MDVRDELVRLYTLYNPQRLKDVDALLTRFKGREHVILEALREKYAKDGASTASNTAPARSSAHSSFLYPNASSVDSDGTDAVSRGVSMLGNVAGQPPTPSYCVPALKPCTTSLHPHRRPDPFGRASTTPPMADARTAAPASISEDVASSPQPSSLSPASTSPPPPPTSSIPHPSRLARAARRTEMHDLLHQMTSLDLGQLATRVEELTRSPSLHEASRVPLLQWRHAEPVPAESSSCSTSAPQGDVAAVLRHTSVFIRFFADSARRYLELAQAEEEEEERRWRELEQQQQRSSLKGDTLSDLSDQRDALHGDSSPLSSSITYTRGTADVMSKAVKEASPSSHRTRSVSDGARLTRTPSPPSPPPPPPQGKPPTHARAKSSSCVRSIRPASGASPLSNDDRAGSSGSPPACRTTTVSPLTSPDGHTPAQRQRQQRERHDALKAQRLRADSPSTPPPAPQQAVSLSSASSPSSLSSSPRSAAANTNGMRHQTASQRDPPLMPPPTSPPPQSLSGLLTTVPAARSPPSRATRVLSWSPAAGQSNRYGPTCTALQSGDSVVLQPGVYYENLHLDHCGCVEITSAYPGAAVVLRPFSDLDPVMTITGAGTQVTLTGIVLVQGGMPAEDAQHATHPRGQPTVPLLSVREGAEVTASACHFYGGAGGGVVAAGPYTRLRLDLCLVSLCGFAGVYVHGGASADIAQSKIKKSEVGLRVLQGSVFVGETTLEANTSDGVVLYEESLGVLERSNVFDNAGNGVFLASGAELRVVASMIELNALYGVQRTRGSTLHVKSSFIRDNGLLPINEELE